MTDQELIELIEKLRPAAALSLQYEHLPLRKRPNDVPTIWEVAEPLKKALKQHPEFAESPNRFFLGKQISFASEYQAMNILRIALDREASDALAWYRRVLAKKCTKMRIIAEVYGLLVQQNHTFSNGVTLLSVSHLPDSPNARALKESFVNGMAIEFPAAVMIDVDDVDEASAKSGHQEFLRISETIRKTITAFVLSDDAAPTMAAGWQEFVDPELQSAEFGRTWMTSSHDGRHSRHPVQLTEVMVSWVEKYLQLPPEVRRFCDIPIARLNLARRRLAAGDKAIDGSVCLEALLSGRARGELTHRLSTRAALLLGQSLSERQEIAQTVRRFYALRSEVVHGGSDAKKDKTAQEGLAVCLAAIRAVVESARLPDPELWELTGGPAWNRYSESRP